MGVRKVEDLPHYTYDDYVKWEGKWELIHGIPYAMSPAPMIRHQQISNKIARELDEILEACEACRALLPVDWKVSDDTVVQPDNLVICHEPQNPAYLTKAPEIVFEVVSPSTAMKDTGVKFSIYEREGVKYYVIVHPDDRVAKVYENRDGRFVKIADATDESVAFELEKCEKKIVFDFSKIW
jgi:Uma2 family endonuclease